MAKTRRTLKRQNRKKTIGGKRFGKSRSKCGCNLPGFFKGGKKKVSKSSKRLRGSRRYRRRKSKKQKGGFIREIRGLIDNTIHLGEKNSATLGGYPQPNSPNPTLNQKPNSSA